MKLLGLEAVQNATYYQSRYRQLVDLGADLFVLNGLGDPDFWPVERYRVAGSQHIDDLVTAARDWHELERFDGVLTFSESGVVAVAAVAEALGLPGVGIEAARTSRNKYLMRRAHERAGVACPKFRLAPDLESALATAGEFGYPVILKPTLGAASNFVFRIDGPEEMRTRFPQALAGIETMGWFTMEAGGVDLGPQGLLVESFLDGPEYLTESVAWDGRVFVGSVVDRVTVEGSTFDDDVHHAPTELGAERLAAVRQLIEDAARAQGIGRGVLHAEVRFHRGVPHILEIAVRPGGGGLDYFARISAGHDPIKSLMDVARGVRPEVEDYRPTEVHTAGTCLIGGPGRVAEISVPREVAESERVFFLKITAKPGDLIRRPPDGNNILGFLCTTGTSFEDAMKAATDLAGRIRVRMADAAPVPDGGVATWACQAGFPPSTIFPFTPPERIGIRNLFEFQTLMYRPLYWLGKDGLPGVDFDLSLAEPPRWSEDGRSVTVRLKPWQWSNGEPICADNVVFWVNMMKVKGARYGNYAPGYFPDNLESYEKVAEDEVRFTFDKQYSKTWVLMNQLSLITPMPRAWDRTAHGPADASANPDEIPAVYDYLVTQNGQWTSEDNEHRGRWPQSPVWSVVSGPWRLQSFGVDGVVTFVPNENYSGPVKPRLSVFRQIPTQSDESQYERLRKGPYEPDSLQVGYLPYGIGAQAAEFEADALPADYRLVPQNIQLVNYMPINFGNPGKSGSILKQTYVRQALQCSLDQDTAIREIFDGYGYRTTGPVPVVPDSGLVSPLQRADPMPFDLGRARRLLEENGWDVSSTPAVCVRAGEGPGRAGAGIEFGDELTLGLRYVDGRVALERLMRQFEASAAQAGIELRLQPVNGSVMVAEDHGEAGPDNPHRWDLQSWNGGWAFYGHPTGEVLFKTGGGSNFGHYGDPRADELIERTVVSDDIEALYEYQDYVAEQVPVIWAPGFPLRVFAVARKLRGFEPVNPYGMLTPENWYYVDDGDEPAEPAPPAAP